MAAISSLGTGSGIDLEGLLTSIMAAEQRPLLTLQTREASYQSRISALGSLNSALATLQTAATSLVPSIGTTAAEKYASFSATVANTDIASATTTTGAVAGSYSLEVSSLAKSQRLVTPSSAGYTSASSPIGTGDLKIEFGSLSGSTFTADSARTKTITIDSTNNTLGGLRDAINSANIGASATIVVGTNGAQLVLASTSTGLSNVMQFSGLTGFDYDPASDTGTLTQASAQGGQAASNAAFSLNGIAATSSTNTVSGVLDGVTLTLNKETTTPTTLTISKNTTTTLTTALNAFITAYNEANTNMTELGAYNAETKVAGELQGNSTLRTAQSQVRNLIFGATAGGTSVYQRLSDIGVTLAKDGSLTLNASKLNAATSADFEGVANLVSTVGTAFKTTINGLIGSTGSITTATDGAQRVIADIVKQQEAMSNRLDAIEALYRAQFTALDTMIASLKKTSSYLTQQLAALSTNTKSS